MLIHALPSRFLHGPGVYLPPEMTAPLAVARGSTLWCTMHVRGKQRIEEIIGSPFAPTTWGDLWNLNIQLIDEPGQLCRLVEFFDKRNIRILHQSSRDTFASSLHTKYFVLDCMEYNDNSVDLTSNHRAHNMSIRLLGLQKELEIEFFHKIRLSPKTEPRLDLARNQVHHDMFCVQKGRGEPGESLSDVKPLVIHKLESKTSYWRTPLKMGVNLRGLIPDDISAKETNDWHAATTVNTKSKVLYVSILNKRRYRLRACPEFS